jgi:threonine synthase
MKFVSTRKGAEPVGLSAAIESGLAPDGGLYVPAIWPQMPPDEVSGSSLPDVAAQVIGPFAHGDPLSDDISAIAAEAFNFPVPDVPVDAAAGLSVLELFHGPTAAFKDLGARFLAGCLARVRRDAEKPLLVLVATSGDTGGAVAAAFHRRPGFEVAIVYPQGLISPLQEAQLTCWDGNVRSFALRGAFDDCQRLVKAALRDQALRERFDVSSANSINIGRLLPQMTYFAGASLECWRESGVPLSFVIPSGNLGHATSCIWARRIGCPIGEIVLAHNANRPLVDYLETGAWRSRASVRTLASAMDVGDPSNAERLLDAFPQVEHLRRAVTAYSIDDDAIRRGIRLGYERYGQIWCPHTAAAAAAHWRHEETLGTEGRWALAATAHPAKFRETVEAIIGRSIPLPPALEDLMSRPRRHTVIDADLGALIGELT